MKSLIALLVLTVSASAQDFTSEQAQQALSRYRMTEAIATRTYISQLEVAQKESVAAGDADEVLRIAKAIEEAKTRLSTLTCVTIRPPVPPPTAAPRVVVRPNPVQSSTVYGRPPDLTKRELTPADKLTVQKLRFINAKFCDTSLRHWSFARGTLKLINASQAVGLDDHLVARMRGLVKTQSGKWVVLDMAQRFQIKKRGAQEVTVNFQVSNKIFELATGSRETAVTATYCQVYYDGNPIWEYGTRNVRGQPKDWWADESLIYKPTQQ